MFDTIITNGVVANATGIIEPPNSDIGIKDGEIRIIGRDLASLLPEGTKCEIIDAKGAYVTPGGVDAHVHLNQQVRGEAMTDQFEPGTRSSICGGTTTLVCFAPQEKFHDNIVEVVEQYLAEAEGTSYCDYGVHMIITNPTDKVVDEELPIIKDKYGITSVKIYMAYEERQLTDRQIMKVMTQTRKLGMTTMIHAENWDMISYIIEDLAKSGKTDPYYHAVSHPGLAEDEATYRAICISELMDTPILLVHVSTATATETIRRAQTKNLPVLGETCPQYLYLMTDRLKEPNFEGAKFVCSPPLRDAKSDIEALWTGLANGTFTILSSDHCPFPYDSPTGKKQGLIDGVAYFTEIPNGLPGVETRLPLGFQGVHKSRFSIQKFVEVTSYNPSLLYGLNRKGQVAPGYDADLVIWYPEGIKYTITNGDLNHACDYTPYEGLEINNWPKITMLRGQVVWDRDNGGLKGAKGYGKYVPRQGNNYKGPRGVFPELWTPEAN